jgi:polyphenol oxidase
VAWQVDLDVGSIHVRSTTRAEGDFAIDGEPVGLAVRRRAIVDRPWVWLRQVHGPAVQVVRAATAEGIAGSEADALVTDEADLVLAIQTADCLPVMLWSAEGVIGAAHAGWRGLDAGVVEATAAAMRDLGATVIEARIGPCISEECYEFGAADLDEVAAGLGDEVRGRTATGSPALDLHRAFGVVARRAGIAAWGSDASCTACHPERWFSHRARAEAERMATVIWRDHPGST